MAGFKRAKAEQAAIKMGIYGPAGSGKTFTALLIAEGLARATGKRVAYVDTERGTDFYSLPVPARTIHPDGFDFDALYTRSITESLSAIRSLNQAEHGVIVIDSVTHLWEACIAAYAGPQTRASTIPMHAWGKIKKPYKEMMTILLSSPLHVIMCGRQGTEYAEDEKTEELKAVGYKMKAEGETPHEPHILIRMESRKPRRPGEVATIMAYVEKDRSSVLSGRLFENPTYETLGAPVLALLGGTQARIATSEETANKDAERLAADESDKIKKSAETLTTFKARIDLAPDLTALAAIGAEITADLKASMMPPDVTALRDHYMERDNTLGGTAGRKKAS